MSDGFTKTGSVRRSAHRDFAPEEKNRGPYIPTALANNPRAGQWDGRRLSRNIVADYKRFIV
ncbi:anaerobic ribonucleoside-triphosphate reductase activating protein, partial [Bifidobacterium bifidum]|nr:anaerobic ribonucleoside-triphosphate reductase activating protein [Bifidobacterium bifidum]